MASHLLVARNFLCALSHKMAVFRERVSSPVCDATYSGRASATAGPSVNIGVGPIFMALTAHISATFSCCTSLSLMHADALEGISVFLVVSHGRGSHLFAVPAGYSLGHLPKQVG